MKDRTTISPQPELETPAGSGGGALPIACDCWSWENGNTLQIVRVPSCCLPLSCSGYHVLLASAAGSSEIWTDPAPLGLPELRDGG